MEHPHFVEGSSPPTTATKGQEGPLRLCEANLARLALLGKGREAIRGNHSSHNSRGSSYEGGGRTASVASVAGSVVKKSCGGGMAPSVTTVGTGLSVAETVIARAQARKGIF